MLSRKLFFAFLCPFLLSIPFFAHSQVNNLRYWQDSYGYALALEEVPGVGLFALLETDPLGTLVKLDFSGEVEWAKELSEEYRFMFLSPDQHIYLLSDETNLVSLVKIDLSGNLLWEKEYSLGAFSHLNMEADMGDEGDVFLAVHGSGQFGGFDTRVMKIDSSGTVQWYKTGYSDCMLAGIVAAQDGGCFVGYNGISPQSSATYREGEIHRFLPGGGLGWARKYDRPFNSIEKMDLTDDGILAVVVNPILGNSLHRYYEVDRWDSLGVTYNGLYIGDTTLGDQLMYIESINSTPDNGIVLGGQLFKLVSPIPNVRSVVFYVGQYAATSFGRVDVDPGFLTINLDKKISAVAGLSGQGLGALAYIGSVGVNGGGINSSNWVGIMADKDSSCSGIPLPTDIVGAPLTVATNPVYSNLTHSFSSTPPTMQPYALQDSLLCQECLENLSASFTTSFNGLTATFIDSTNGGQLTWDFGDGNTGTGTNPSHAYAIAGTYTVCLTAAGICDTVTTCEMVGLTLGQEENLLGMLTVFPNPANQSLNLDFTEVQSELELRLFDVKGQVVLNEWNKGIRKLKLDVSTLENGVYFLELRNKNRRWGQRVLVQH